MDFQTHLLKGILLVLCLLGALSCLSSVKTFMRVELGRDNTYFYMAKSAFVMRLVNLRSVTYYTDQNRKSKCSFHSSKSLYLDKTVKTKLKDVSQP